MRKKPLGKTQRKVLKTLEALKEKEKAEWVGLHVLIIMCYHPEHLDGSLGYRDWTYSENERKTVWDSVRRLEKRGLIKTRIQKVSKVYPDKVKFSGIQWWKEISLNKLSISDSLGE